VTRTERAHAKINLLLRILAREASGYHGIETLFQRLALHDVVQVTVSDAPCALTCDGPAMPTGGIGAPEQNLAWRAAQLYCNTAGWSTGWQIAIEKHIPVGGGLGGGSADAAAVLRALEALCPAPLGLPRLLALAGTLGADVPFMVLDVPLAWAWGRGDRLLPVPALPAMAVTLVAFEQGVNTGAAYGAFARARELHGTAVGATAYSANAFASWDSVCALAGNDFEQVVPQLHEGVASILPLLRQAAAALHTQGNHAIGMMSGSGATCFLLHPAGMDGLGESLVLPPGARLVHTATL
jgi:4-diphosphocytidyl-2-C-methyl-D-erythritol kinase